MATPSAKDMLMQVQRYAEGGDVQSEGLTLALARGLTQEQYDQNIREYASKKTNQLEALNAMSAYGISMADANRALGAQTVRDYFTVDPNIGEAAPSSVVQTNFTSPLQQAFLSTPDKGQAVLDARIREVAAQNVGNPEALRELFLQNDASIADIQRAGVDPSILYSTLARTPKPVPPVIPTKPVIPTVPNVPYAPTSVYQPYAEPTPIYAAGQPALDVDFRNSAPRTYDPRYGYVYTPAASLRPATGAGMSFTPPSVTSRPRSLLNVDLPVDTGKPYSTLTPAEKANLRLSASQYYARDRAAAQQLAALPGGRFSGMTAPAAPAIGAEGVAPTDLRFYSGPTQTAAGLGTPPTGGGLMNSGTLKLDQFGNPLPFAAGGSVKKPEGTADPSARAMLDNLDSEAPVKRNLPKEAQDARRARVGMAPAVPQDYSGRDVTGELLNAASLATMPVPFLGDAAELVAQMDRIGATPNTKTPTPDPVRNESQSMLRRLITGFEENIAKPAVGSVIDMTLGLADIGQMGAKYLANRAGLETQPFVSTAEPAKAAVGVTGYDPYTIGGIATNLLPFARGKQAIGGAAKTFASMFPNLGREALSYAGGEAGAAAARELLPDSTLAQVVAGGAGSIAAGRGGPPTMSNMASLGNGVPPTGSAANMLNDLDNAGSPLAAQSDVPVVPKTDLPVAPTASSQMLKEFNETGAVSENVSDSVAPPTESAKMPDDLDLAGGKVSTFAELYKPPVMTDPIAIKFNDEVLENPLAVLKAYTEHPDSKGGKIVDTDIFREFSTDYQADKTLASVVHPVASALQQAYLKYRLLTTQGEPGTWIFPGGGPASGKSSGLPQSVIDKAHTVVDGTLAGSERAISEIKSVLADPGRKVLISWIDREPVKALDLAMGRANEKGRTVPLEAILAKNLEARVSIRKIAKEFEGNERVAIEITDNNGLQADAFKSSVDKIKDYDYNEQAEMMIKRLEEARKNEKISQNIFNGIDSDFINSFTRRAK